MKRDWYVHSLSLAGNTTTVASSTGWPRASVIVPDTLATFLVITICTPLTDCPGGNSIAVSVISWPLRNTDFNIHPCGADGRITIGSVTLRIVNDQSSPTREPPAPPPI